eukprot:TRINITY_DN13949_c0_g1_i1.p1 TRINITY_DN13949_c0_g1~~TRINITY_DN13949_c0_g1_i1.p1  ORF type:complete len:526 (+),score=103.50 TRINITY_DN13949_c0_g1_i1:423-2000(+)
MAALDKELAKRSMLHSNEAGPRVRQLLGEIAQVSQTQDAAKIRDDELDKSIRTLSHAMHVVQNHVSTSSVAQQQQHSLACCFDMGVQRDCLGYNAFHTPVVHVTLRNDTSYDLDTARWTCVVQMTERKIIGDGCRLTNYCLPLLGLPKGGERNFVVPIKLRCYSPIFIRVLLVYRVGATGILGNGPDADMIPPGVALLIGQKRFDILDSLLLTTDNSVTNATTATALRSNTGGDKTKHSNKKGRGTLPQQHSAHDASVLLVESVPEEKITQLLREAANKYSHVHNITTTSNPTSTTTHNLTTTAATSQLTLKVGLPLDLTPAVFLSLLVGSQASEASSARVIASTWRNDRLLFRVKAAGDSDCCVLHVKCGTQLLPLVRAALMHRLAILHHGGSDAKVLMAKSGLPTTASSINTPAVVTQQQQQLGRLTGAIDLADRWDRELMPSLRQNRDKLEDLFRLYRDLFPLTTTTPTSTTHNNKNTQQQQYRQQLLLVMMHAFGDIQRVVACLHDVYQLTRTTFADSQLF